MGNILRLVVHHHGNLEVTVNGLPLHRSDVQVIADEDLYSRIDLQQQWAVLCQLRKVLAQLADVHDRSRILQGELPASDYERMLRMRAIGSGAKGVAGIRPLPRGTREAPLVLPD
jgi:hypothetical protein